MVIESRLARHARLNCSWKHDALIVSEAPRGDTEAGRCGEVKTGSGLGWGGSDGMLAIKSDVSRDSGRGWKRKGLVWMQ